MLVARGQVRDCLSFAFGDRFARDSGRELPGLVGEVLFFLGLVFVEEDRVGSTGTVAGEEPVEAVCDGLVEGVLSVPTVGDSARHEEVDVFRGLFAVDGVGRE